MDEIMDDVCCGTCGYNKSKKDDVALCELVWGRPEEKAIDDYCYCYNSDKDPLPVF